MPRFGLVIESAILALLASRHFRKKISENEKLSIVAKTVAQIGSKPTSSRIVRSVAKIPNRASA